MSNLTYGWWEEFERMDPPTWVMKFAWALWMALIVALTIGAMLLPMVAQADGPSVVYRGVRQQNCQPMALRLFATKCSNAAVLKILQVRIKPEYLDQFFDAKLSWDGREYASCWLEIDGHVVSIDEEGAPLQPIPLAAFKDEAL